MNIILTQQDADFILKYIRQDIERIAEARSELEGNYSDLCKHYTERLKDNKTAKELMSFANEFTSMVREATTEAKNDLEKCILLLTVGSEDLK